MISLMLLPVKSETSHQKYKHNVTVTEFSSYEISIRTMKQ